jgi:hypothetical protein
MFGINGYTCIYTSSKKIKEEDKVLYFNCTDFVLDQLAEDADYLKVVVFVDETIFHIKCRVNGYNCHIRGPHNTGKHDFCHKPTF